MSTSQVNESLSGQNLVSNIIKFVSFFHETQFLDSPFCLPNLLVIWTPRNALKIQKSDNILPCQQKFLFTCMLQTLCEKDGRILSTLSFVHVNLYHPLNIYEDSD